MKGRFVFVVVGGENLRIVPVNITVGTMTSVFGDPRYMFIRFRRGHIIFVLGHASAEGDTCLTYIFRLWRIGSKCPLSPLGQAEFYLVHRERYQVFDQVSCGNLRQQHEKPFLVDDEERRRKE